MIQERFGVPRYLRRIRDRIDSLVHKEVMDANRLQSIEGILVDNVLPVIGTRHRTLLMGVGDRSEEIAALTKVLEPTEVIALEPHPDRYRSAVRKWHSFLRQQPNPLHRHYDRVVSIHQTRFEAVVGEYFDLAAAFSFHGTIQFQHVMDSFIRRSQKYIVVTAHNAGGIGWGDRSEPEHIDDLIAANPDVDILVRMKEIDYNTTDGHIWIMKKKESPTAQ